MKKHMVLALIIALPLLANAGGKTHFSTSSEPPKTQSAVEMTLEEQEAALLEEIIRQSQAEDRERLSYKHENADTKECDPATLQRELERVSVDPQTPTSYKTYAPIAVFGTLRSGFKNHWHMGKNAVSHSHPDHTQVSHHFRCRTGAFLPHFVASRLQLKHQPNATAPFEVYFYSPENWKNAIQLIDPLESFYPDLFIQNRIDGAYIRTLARVRLIPNTHCQNWLDPSGNVWEEGRNCEIPSEEWVNYPEISVWIYVSKAEAEKSQKEGLSPIQWPLF